MAEAAQREWNEKQWLHYLYDDVLLASCNLQLFSYSPSPDLRVSGACKSLTFPFMKYSYVMVLGFFPGPIKISSTHTRHVLGALSEIATLAIK